AKNILSSRLRVLVELGLFEVQPASDGSAYKEYVLTEKGRSIFPIVVSMRQWGERYMFEEGEVHSILVDNDADKAIALLEVRSSKGKKLEPKDCHRRRVVMQSV
uniref:winged helix-turn-helix transcriptional regulator n=1 Tax=Pseudomonas sp. TaxID=306 RepID=UPI00260D8E7A